MARRLVCSLILTLLLAGPALAHDVYGRKQNVDAKIARLRARIDAAQQREASLSAEISSVTARIRTLEGQVGDVSSRLVVLEHDLALHQHKLDRLRELFRVQTVRYRFLRGQYTTALDRLNHRLVEIYQADEVDALDVVLEASSFTELLEQLDYFEQLGSQDKIIAKGVGDAKAEVRRARARTRKTKAVVASATRVIALRTAQVRSIRDRLVAQESQLVSVRNSKRSQVASARERKDQAASEAAALAEVSAQLAAQIQSASGGRVSASPAAAPAAVSSNGLIWPVAGPVTSGFGMRWGRLHAGIDIGAGYGTPVRAAASGVVISAGWMGGYGNLVAIDHGGGLATAYAHLSGFAVSGGSVGQGQVIGYVGCTGHCFGPHLHFEVRVSGSPVDPLGYL
jgi:murein DD-endopeptidase MepM/ murein hydrolase activator NlpD